MAFPIFGMVLVLLFSPGLHLLSAAEGTPKGEVHPSPHPAPPGKGVPDPGINPPLAFLQEVSWEVVPETPPTRDHPLFSLYERAVTQSPVIQAVLREREGMRKGLPALSAPPNPMLQGEWENSSLNRYTVGKDEMSRIGVMAEQRFVLGGKLALAGREGELELQGLTEAYRKRQGEIFLELASLYGELYRVERKLVLLSELFELLELLRANRLAQLRTGTASLLEFTELELKGEVLRLELEELKASREELLASLRRILGTAELSLPSPLPPPPSLKLPEPLPSLEGTPEVQEAQLKVERARVQGLLKERALLPDLSVGLGVMSRGSAFPPMGTVRLSLELPLYFYRKEIPEKERALYLTLAREEEERQRRLEVEELWQRTRARLAFLESTLPSYEEKLRTLTPLVRSGLFALYQGEGGSTALLLQGIELLYEAEDRLLAFTAEKLKLKATLLSLFPERIMAQVSEGGQP